MSMKSPHGRPDSPHQGFTCVRVENTVRAKAIEPGDSFWWQGDYAFWTPQNRYVQDLKMRRTSYSYFVEAS